MAWYGERVKQRLRSVSTRIVREKAELLQREHQKDLSTSFPPASKQRQYPRLRTGNLRQAVKVSVMPAKAGGEAKAQVYYDTAQAPYIKVLLARGRRGITETFARIRSRLASMSHQKGGGSTAVGRG